MATDAYAVSIADVSLPAGTLASLHPHPLTVVRRADLQTVSHETVFGLAGASVCGHCSALTYGACAVCADCGYKACLKCYDTFAEEQSAMLREIVDRRHGTGSPAHRLKEQRTRRLRTSATVHENRQLPPIFAACARGDLAALKEIVDKSVFSNTLDLEEPCEVGEHRGATLLTIAARLGLRDIVEMLLARGASTEAIDPKGMTPLMHAAYSGHADVVEKLVFAKAAVDKVAICGYTALLFAANRGHALCIERLLAGGAKRTVRNPSGRTAIIIAALNGHTAAVRFLTTVVPHHEVATLRDNEGYTALDAAIAARHTAIERMLRGIKETM